MPFFYCGVAGERAGDCLGKLVGVSNIDLDYTFPASIYRVFFYILLSTLLLISLAGCLWRQYIQFVPSERMRFISSSVPHSMPKAVKCELYTMQTMELRRSSLPKQLPHIGHFCACSLPCDCHWHFCTISTATSVCPLVECLLGRWKRVGAYSV